jgi:hypothetical protein
LDLSDSKQVLRFQTIIAKKNLFSIELWSKNSIEFQAIEFDEEHKKVILRLYDDILEVLCDEAPKLDGSQSWDLTNFSSNIIKNQDFFRHCGVNCSFTYNIADRRLSMHTTGLGACDGGRVFDLTLFKVSRVKFLLTQRTLDYLPKTEDEFDIEDNESEFGIPFIDKFSPTDGLSIIQPLPELASNLDLNLREYINGLNDFFRLKFEISEPTKTESLYDIVDSMLKTAISKSKFRMIIDCSNIDIVSNSWIKQLQDCFLPSKEGKSIPIIVVSGNQNFINKLMIDSQNPIKVVDNLEAAVKYFEE